MLKLMKSKVISALVLVALVVSCLFGGQVLASTLFPVTLPCTMTVDASNPNLGIFSDTACTVPLTSINWGTVKQGKNYTQTIYINNTGDYNFAGVVCNNNLPASVGTITATINGLTASVPIVQNQTYATVVTLCVPQNATTGSAPFNLVFNCTY
jgi:hypothetical protein